MNSRWLLLFLLSGCAGGLSSYQDLNGLGPDDGQNVPGDTDDTAPPPDDGPNTAPVADAGDDLLLPAGQLANLDGSASYDPDDDVLWHRWTMTDHPPGWSGQILDASFAAAEFWPDLAGTYEATLEVDDGSLTATDTVVIVVEEPNGVPVANAGSDTYADVGDRVQLDGSTSFDPESEALDYRWRLLDAPVSSSAQLSSTTVARPNIVVDVAGVYVVELAVQDASGNLSYPDDMRIVVEEGGADEPGGGGGLCGCLSCAAASDRLSAGDAAAAPFLLSLPLLFVLLRRRDP